MWEAQLASMVSSNHLDHDSISDLNIAYVAETGDETDFGGSLPGVVISVFIPQWHVSRSYSGSLTAVRSRSLTRSRMGTRGKSYSEERDGRRCCWSESNNESWSMSTTHGGKTRGSKSIEWSPK